MHAESFNMIHETAQIHPAAVVEDGAKIGLGSHLCLVEHVTSLSYFVWKLTNPLWNLSKFEVKAPVTYCRLWAKNAGSF